MEVRIQSCQACGSNELHNILVREEGRRQAVCVRCAQCRKLVAHYILYHYYHHGKGLESFLRSAGISTEESGREWLDRFNEAKLDAENVYTKAQQHLKDAGDDISPNQP